MFLDEFHMISSSPEFQQASASFLRKFPRKFAVNTQAVIHANSGKRLTFIGQSYRPDGSSWKVAPKKHIPAQVLRRKDINPATSTD